MIKESPKNIKLLISIILSFIINYNYAQTWVAGQNVTLHVNSYALIATNFAPVNLTLSAPTAGSPVSTATNSDLYVKISSIVPFLTHREVTARIVSGAVPAGTTLTLKSAACTTANSGGNRGTPVANPITLSNNDQYLVSNIRTCYTGTGYNDGYKMTFTWSVLNPLVNYQLLASNTYNITVVFTLTDYDYIW